MYKRQLYELCKNHLEGIDKQVFGLYIGMHGHRMRIKQICINLNMIEQDVRSIINRLFASMSDHTVPLRINSACEPIPSKLALTVTFLNLGHKLLIFQLILRKYVFP